MEAPTSVARWFSCSAAASTSAAAAVFSFTSTTSGLSVATLPVADFTLLPSFVSICTMEPLFTNRLAISTACVR